MIKTNFCFTLFFCRLNIQLVGLGNFFNIGEQHFTIVDNYLTSLLC